MLNILLNLNISNEIILIISCIILLIIISFVVFNIINSKRKEEKEIDEIISNMVKERKEENEETIEEVDDKTKELEDVLEKMQKDLDAKPVDVVASFEREQEEKAIISYNELVKTLKKGKEEEKTLDILVDEIKEAAALNEEKEDKKFKNTDFISPVYGKMEEHLEYPKVSAFKQEELLLKELEDFDKKMNDYKLEDYLEEFHCDNNANTLEQTLDMEPISTKIKQNEEFLNALKEFRENL